MEKKVHLKKRNNYISWNDYFMHIALLSAMRSKDPNTQVGACIVNEHKIIVGVGYNGLPHGLSDDNINWTNDKKIQNNKYCYVIHAEVNAILNSNSKSLANCCIYVTHFPCYECGKVIIQSKINKIFYYDDKHLSLKDFQISQEMLIKANIKIQKIEINKLLI